MSAAFFMFVSLRYKKPNTLQHFVTPSLRAESAVLPSASFVRRPVDGHQVGNSQTVSTGWWDVILCSPLFNVELFSATLSDTHRLPAIALT